MDDLEDLECLLLKRQSQRHEFNDAANTLQHKCPNVAISEDILFDEVSSLLAFLQTGVLEQWRGNQTSLV